MTKSEKKSATFFNAEVRGFSVLHDLCDSHGTNGYLLQQFFSNNFLTSSLKKHLFYYWCPLKPEQCDQN